MAWPLVTKLFGFDPKKPSTASAASSLVCLVHGFPITYGSYTFIINNPTWDISAPLSAFSLESQTLAVTLLNFCAAYMLQDLLMMGVNAWVHTPASEPNLTSFCLHHTGCVLYMSLVHYYGAGHLSLMVLIFFGEVTNPLQNLVNLAVNGRTASLTPGGRQLWSKIDNFLALPFGLIFFLVRAVLGPLLAASYLAHFGWGYWIELGGTGSNDVPFFVGILWTVMVCATVHGSVPFAVEKLERAGLWGQGEKGGEKRE